jgi:hypothetical protein
LFPRSKQQDSNHSVLFNMMLSPQAARMGTVFTTLRKIGHHNGRPKARHRIFPSSLHHFNSTLASNQDHDDDLDLASWKPDSSRRENVEPKVQQNPSPPMTSTKPLTTFVPTSSSSSSQNNHQNHRFHEKEAWTVNLGRENDDWLHGVRSFDWFTGMHPSWGCPGKMAMSFFVESVHL